MAILADNVAYLPVFINHNVHPTRLSKGKYRTSSVRIHSLVFAENSGPPRVYLAARRGEGHPPTTVCRDKQCTRTCSIVQLTFLLRVRLEGLFVTFVTRPNLFQFHLWKEMHDLARGLKGTKNSPLHRPNLNLTFRMYL